MRKHFFKILIFTILLPLSACRPKDVLSTRQMREVLLDLHYTEAVLQTAGYNYGHDEAVQRYYYETLKRHGVTQAQFDSSLVWYTDHPERFNKIYPKVIVRMEEKIQQAEETLETARQEKAGAPKPTKQDTPLREVQIQLLLHGVPAKWGFETPKSEAQVPFLEKNEEK